MTLKRLAILLLVGVFGLVSVGAVAVADEHEADPDPAVVVAEMSTRGPTGATDNFIRIENVSDDPADVSGWVIERCNNNRFAGTQVVIPEANEEFDGVVLQPGEDYLVAHADGYSGSRAPDQAYGTSITDEGGGRILDGDANVVDGVGFGPTETNLCTQGEPASPLTTGEGNDGLSHHRVDSSGNNAEDFEKAPRTVDEPTEPTDPFDGVRISQTANGGPGSSFDNFIELENYGDEPVDVNGWEVLRCFGSGALASQPQVPAFGDVVLDPGENILLAHDDFTGPEPDARYSDSLANAGYGVLVRDDDGGLVDRFAAHTGNPDSPCADGEEFPDSLTFADNEAYQRVDDTGDNASDFEIISPRDPQALGRPILPEPPETLPICEVMGPGLHSPFVPDPDPEQLANLSDEEVTTTGIVYATQTTDTFNNGFWMQMADHDDSECPDGASRGIYVFVQSIRGDTPSMPNLGDEVVATGPINEFFGESTQLQVNNPSGYDTSLDVVSTGNDLPEPTVIDADEAFAQDAEQMYYASLHQARAELEFGQSYVGSSKFGESWLVPQGIDERIRRTDERYDLFALDDAFLPGGGVLDVFAFDEVENAFGPLDHSFGNYKLVVEDIEGVEHTDNQEDRPHPITERPEGTHSVATFNIEDIFGNPLVIFDDEQERTEEDLEPRDVLAPGDYEGDGTERDDIIEQPDRPDVSVITTDLEERERREAMVALAVVDWMQMPTVIHTQEVANETLMMRMADRINQELDDRGLDGQYEHVYVPGIDERYIDVGYLVDTTRATVDEDSLDKIDIDAPGTAPPGDPEDTGRCNQGPGGQFLHDRAPLRADITDDATGEVFTHVTIHNKSRFGGTEANEEFEPCRVDQSQSVIDYLDEQGIDENVMIGGDINTFRDSPTLDLYEESGFVPLVDDIPEDRRFSYQFDGRVQFLDHLIATPDVAERVEAVDSPKIVNDIPWLREFEDATTAFAASDHEPLVAFIDQVVEVPGEAVIGDIRGRATTGRELVVPVAITDAAGDPVEDPEAAELTVEVEGPDGEPLEAGLVDRDDAPGGYNVKFRADEAGEHTVRVFSAGVEIGERTFEVAAQPGRGPGR